MHGIIRRSSSFNTQRIDHIYRDRHESAVRLKLHYGDLTDSTNLMHIIYEVRTADVTVGGGGGGVGVVDVGGGARVGVGGVGVVLVLVMVCLLYTSPSPRD